jgi:hypothetical protein
MVTTPSASRVLPSTTPARASARPPVTSATPGMPIVPMVETASPNGSFLAITSWRAIEPAIGLPSGLCMYDPVLPFSAPSSSLLAFRSKLNGDLVAGGLLPPPLPPGFFEPHSSSAAGATAGTVSGTALGDAGGGGGWPTVAVASARAPWYWVRARPKLNGIPSPPVRGTTSNRLERARPLPGSKGSSAAEAVPAKAGTTNPTADALRSAAATARRRPAALLVTALPNPVQPWHAKRAFRSMVPAVSYRREACRGYRLGGGGAPLPS